jgi:hypothetical protein
VSENRVPPGRIFGKREEVARCWRRLHKGELKNFCASQNIIKVTKLWRISWAGHVARMGGMINRVLWLENLKERDHSEDLGIDGNIILEWFLWK